MAGQQQENEPLSLLSKNDRHMERALIGTWRTDDGERLIITSASDSCFQGEYFFSSEGRESAPFLGKVQGRYAATGNIYAIAVWTVLYVAPNLLDEQGVTATIVSCLGQFYWNSNDPQYKNVMVTQSTILTVRNSIEYEQVMGNIRYTKQT